MSHWQLRLQLNLLSKELNSFSHALFLSFILHVLIFIIPFLFINNTGVIIIDSTGKYQNLPVYYKSGIVTGVNPRAISGQSGLGRIKSRNKSGYFSNRKFEKVYSPARSEYSSKKNVSRDRAVPKETNTNSFCKIKKFSNQGLSKLKNNKKSEKKSKIKNVKNIKEKVKEAKETSVIEEILDEKLKPQETLDNLSTQESNLPNNIIIESGDNPENITGFAVDGYLHPDGELVDSIRNAVGKNWSKPKGFSIDVYCEFKILVSPNGESIKILDQKNSNIPAFNIQARGAILRTRFPEKCWNKELNLILR